MKFRNEKNVDNRVYSWLSQYSTGKTKRETKKGNKKRETKRETKKQKRWVCSV